MYKVGIIGFGRIGKLRAKLTNNHPDLILDSVCEVSPISPSEMPDCHIFTFYQDLLKRELDIVFVCTSNNILSKAVIDSLRAGCHVFAEKPPGRNVQEAQDMVEEEKRNPGLKLKFGFNHRYHDSVLHAFRLASGGRLGKVLSVRGVYGKSGSDGFEAEWRNKREQSGGGILLDQGIHMLDLMLLFCDEFTEIKSFVDTLHWSIDVEDNAFAIMKNKDNQIGMLLSSSTQWRHNFHLEVTLEDGYISLKGILSGSMSYGRESLTVARKTYEQDNIGNPIEEVFYYDFDQSWEREVEEFIECIKKNIPIRVGTSTDALKVIELVYKIYQADANWSAKNKDIV